LSLGGSGHSHALFDAGQTPVCIALQDGRLMNEQGPHMQTNLGNLDRGIRVSLGLVMIAATLFGYIGVWGWLGVVPLVTAFFGFCPAYLPFGFSTCRSGSA
jgi:Protein of unknown function (DUF2892)